jgi:hypothetical protein
MDPATIALITALIGLAIKYEPEIYALGQEILLLIKGNLSPEDLVKIQAFTDAVNAKAIAAEDARLSLPPSDTGD